jgi:hypothetical protein
MLWCCSMFMPLTTCAREVPAHHIALLHVTSPYIARPPALSLSPTVTYLIPSSSCSTYTTASLSKHPPTATRARTSDSVIAAMPVRFKWNECRHKIRRLKIKYLNKHGGPPVPSKDADLYFDWRRMRDKPKQTPENVHPGTQWFP